MRRIRVGFFVPSLGGGGAERATLDLASALDAARYEVTVFVDREASSRYRVADHVQVVHFSSTSVIKSALRLRVAVRDARLDLLYSALPHLNFISAVVMRLPGRRPKLVMSVHNNLDMEFGELSGGRLWRFLTPWTYRAANKIVGVSSGVAEQTVTLYRAPKEKVLTIPNPLDIAHINSLADAPVEHRWLTDAYDAIVVVGRLVPQKNLDLALRAFGKLALTHPRARLLLLGDGPSRGDIESLAHDIGISDRIDLVGEVENPFSYMRKSAGLALTSRYEGFGMVLAEGLAAGAAIVSTDCDFGPRDILEGGQCGRLVPPGNVAAFAEALAAALDDVRTTDQLRARGRESVSRFSLEAVVMQLDSLIDQLVRRAA